MSGSATASTSFASSEKHPVKASPDRAMGIQFLFIGHLHTE
ncbi:hypothetical protein D037_4351 [Vibrio parahaemolyticus IDH02640]|nr:hypothetical protein D037_4351 [Vibrio parahaemolyticus IDH02640]